MRLFTKTWMMAAAICIAGFAQVNAQNLVQNGDFLFGLLINQNLGMYMMPQLHK